MVKRRVAREGISFLTKALPRLGKALDRALTGEVSLDSTGFRKESGSQLPKFLGGLFQRVFTLDGWVLPTPCVTSIKHIRQVLYLLYKYKLPYALEQEHKVISSFEKTEDELLELSERFAALARDIEAAHGRGPVSRLFYNDLPNGTVIRKARLRLHRLFARFDPRDIVPSHGPGAVAGRQQLWEKWTWDSVSPRLINSYPLDAYFYASLGHVCDDLEGMQRIQIQEKSARVILVPKDSRGPRLISCEPQEFQWIQQGLSRAIVRLVESHPLTRWNVNFTDQRPNQRGALLGSTKRWTPKSSSGSYASLDLKDASDRVTVGLVRLLFPEPLQGFLLDSRSLSTELPGGKVRDLCKFAPMGSALCFPVLALTIWSILTAGAPDADTREGILVYGDDVIVPTAYAAYAIELLESFGLKVNRDKSCTTGFFRESCGTDAFDGTNVTPVRLRTVWSSRRCPHVYTSWIAYANSFWDRRFLHCYEWITSKLFEVYGEIPDVADNVSAPSLAVVPAHRRPKRSRVASSKSRNDFHRRQLYVWDVTSPSLNREIDGWKMLFRYFTEGSTGHPADDVTRCNAGAAHNGLLEKQAFAVRLYTKRKTIKLVKRWR